MTKTDKSDRLCLLTENGYIQIGELHVEGDIVKNREEMNKNEDILNCHAQQICRLLGLCDGQNCSRRLKSAMLNQNTLPPSLYFPSSSLPHKGLRAHNLPSGILRAPYRLALVAL